MIEIRLVEFQTVTPFSGSRCFEELHVRTLLDVDGIPAVITVAFNDPVTAMDEPAKAKYWIRSILQKIVPAIDTKLKWSKAFDEAVEREGN